MEIIRVDLEDITEKRLLAVMNQNKKTISLMRKEIEKLQKASEGQEENEFVIKDTKELEKEPSEEESIEESTVFEDEVNFYLSEIDSITEENLEEQLETALPVRENYNYEKLLLRLKLELLKNIREVKELLGEEHKNITKEDLQEFQEEIILNQRKIQGIEKALSKTKNQEEKKESVQNKLIFVPTTGGNIRVLEEIAKKIPNDYYEKFITLFDSIKDGTFKNVKRFTSNNALFGICEVKTSNTRVLFDRLDQHTYAIISAFVKKTTKDKGYQESMKKSIGDYKMMEEKIIANLDNEEYLNINSLYEEELYRILGNEKRSPKNKRKES